MSSIHDPTYIEFVSRLRNERIRQKLTQSEFAKKLGMRQSFVAKVETCERRLDIVEAAYWCITLNITFQEVLPKDLSSVIQPAFEL